MKLWPAGEIATLRKLRERFLAGTAGAHDYWRYPDELPLYDATFGERIGWKWDAVLRELVLRGWQPRSRRVLDWGCGSGIAGRRALGTWNHFTDYAAHDRSALAMRFAAERVRTEFPLVEASPGSEVGEDTLLLLSHVISELSNRQLDELIALAQRAGEIIWVEAGTHTDSRRLIEVRERLLRDTGVPPVQPGEHRRDAGATFEVIAPCTHRAACGLLTAKNERHWCHHFAKVPSEVFQDARWAEFGRELGIDLRSLPYSFLVLDRDSAPQPPGFSRVIGEPREFKGYAKVLSCHVDGVTDLMLQKRDAPALHKAVLRGDEAPLYRWQIADGRIVGGEKLA